MSERTVIGAEQWRVKTEFEQNIQDWLGALGSPLKQALEEEYAVERGWLVCGPASIALSRLMQMQSGLPIGQGRPDEHLELSMGFFDPQAANYTPSDHTHLRYHDGLGHIYFIDMIYNQLWPGAARDERSIIVEQFTPETIDEGLVRHYGLYPVSYFEQVRPRLGPFDPWGENDFSEQAFNDFIGALNQPDVTSDLLLTDSGIMRNVSRFWGQRVQRVIDHTQQLYEQQFNVAVY